jgi:predicted alpha/beta-hydrolase family hydrolase
MDTKHDLDTPHGRARVHLHTVAAAHAALVLGHGAGGGITARDLVTAADVAAAERWSVALVEQPYRVAGRRSSGARVACRTAAATGAVGVLCLAFPLEPPRRSGAAPAPSRLPELDAVPVPTLVVQGARDPFGMPPAAARRIVVQVAADHSLRTDLQAVGDAVGAWLRDVVRAASG